VEGGNSDGDAEADADDAGKNNNEDIIDAMSVQGQ